MSNVTIEVVRDPASGKPGEAILRLVGVFELPASPVFRIDSLDEDAARTPPQGWPAGDLTPRAMRIGETGVELLIGADVVDAEALRPGTPVAISVPAANLRRELRWPTLPVTRAERRSAVVVSGEKRAADLAARAQAQRAELARITAARLEAERQDREAAEAMLAARLVAAAESGHSAAQRGAGASGGAATETATLSLVKSQPNAPESGKTGPQLRVVPPPLPSPDAAEAAADDASAAAPPPLPSDTETAARASTRGTSAGAGSASLQGRGSPAAEALPGTDDSAGDILARQMSKREAPSRAVGSSLYKAFAMGFVVSAALAYAASLFLPGDDGLSRRRADESARQLMIEADGLRQRLTAETETRRTLEADWAKRIAAAESAGSASERLAGEVTELRNQVAAKTASLQQAQSELARLRAAAEAAAPSSGEIEAMRKSLAEARSKTEAAEQARAALSQEIEPLRARLTAAEGARTTAASEVEDLRKSLAEAQTKATAAEQARALLATEAEQLRSRLAAVPAGTVTLKVKGSEFEVTGELKSFDGQRFIIEAPGAGPMTLDATRVDCSGDGCPKR